MGSESFILLPPLYERRDAIASGADSAMLFDASGTEFGIPSSERAQPENDQYFFKWLM